MASVSAVGIMTFKVGILRVRLWKRQSGVRERAAARRLGLLVIGGYMGAVVHVRGLDLIRVSTF